MKKMKFIAIVLLVITSLQKTEAQIEKDPSHWAYGLKKLAGNNYEVHLLATIDDGWHIYAQKQPPSAVATATKIAFVMQSGLALVGKSAELGKKETYTIKEAGVINYEYSGKVDFVQKVSIKAGIKEIKGNITYQTCTHEHCLQPQTISFTIPVN